MTDDADPRRASMRRDLRHIVAAQEAYRVLHDEYAPDYLSLQRAMRDLLSPGNVAEVVGEQGGYKALVRSTEAAAESVKYTVYVGTTAVVAGKPAGQLIQEAD